MYKNQRGFSAVEIIIAVVLLAGIGAGIYFAVINQQKAASTKTAPDTSSSKKSDQKSDSDPNQFQWSSSQQGPYHDKISYAASTDLLHWTDSGKIIAEHTSVPDAIVKDGKIYVYFVDVNTDGKPEQIGLKTSSDKGATWSATTIVTGLGDGTAVDPDPFVLPDGRIRLYYYVTRSRDPNDASVHSIYSAISTDGKTFTQEKGTRFSKEQIVDPDVIKVGNTWRMYVGGPNRQILSATSSDGLTFTYEGVADQGGVPNAYYDGSRYLLYGAGINASTSTDGKSFTPLGQQFKAFAGADPGVVKLGTNSYLMVYKINTGQNGPPQPPKP